MCQATYQHKNKSNYFLYCLQFILPLHAFNIELWEIAANIST